jgi:hypothetical protein
MDDQKIMNNANKATLAAIAENARKAITLLWRKRTDPKP